MLFASNSYLVVFYKAKKFLKYLPATQEEKEVFVLKNVEIDSRRAVNGNRLIINISLLLPFLLFLMLTAEIYFAHLEN